MDKLAVDFVKSGISTVGGAALSKLTYEIQENVYNRPNSLKGLSEFLHNPDFLTSYAYPLALAYGMRTFLKFGEMLYGSMNDKVTEKAINQVSKLIPIVVLGLNIWNEFGKKIDYQDNPALDLVMGAIAVTTYILSTEDKKEYEKAIKRIAIQVKTKKFDETKDVI